MVGGSEANEAARVVSKKREAAAQSHIANGVEVEDCARWHGAAMVVRDARRHDCEDPRCRAAVILLILRSGDLLILALMELVGHVANIAKERTFAMAESHGGRRGDDGGTVGHSRRRRR